MEGWKMTKLLVGSLVVLLLLVILGIILAKKTAGWILYACGAGAEVLFISSLRTQQALAGDLEWSLPMGCRIAFYLIVFAGGAAMLYRRSKALDQK